LPFPETALTSVSQAPIKESIIGSEQMDGAVGSARVGTTVR
jgi:hypothetical protein